MSTTAKAHLETLLDLAMAGVERFKPKESSSQADWDVFEVWCRLAMDAATAVLPYQSPQFTAIESEPISRN